MILTDLFLGNSGVKMIWRGFAMGLMTLATCIRNSSITRTWSLPASSADIYSVTNATIAASATAG